MSHRPKKRFGQSICSTSDTVISAYGSECGRGRWSALDMACALCPACPCLNMTSAPVTDLPLAVKAPGRLRSAAPDCAPDGSYMLHKRHSRIESGRFTTSVDLDGTRATHASHISGIVGTASGTQVSVEHKRSLFPGLMAPSRQACTCPATTAPASIRSQCPRPGQPRLAGHGLPAAFRSDPARTSRRPPHRAPVSPPHPATP